MNLLLDTHVFIWWIDASPKLGAHARKMIVGTRRSAVSAATIWEIAIKTAAGRLRLPLPMEDWVMRIDLDWGMRALPITFEHAMAVRDLPAHHNDPFDRMLVAQARCENLTIVTADPAIRAYDVRTIDALA
jgi:PIN domain nuclease of toxin-antitoxin system